MVTRFLHRAFSRLLSCRAAPLPGFQRPACKLQHAQYYATYSTPFLLDQGMCASIVSRPRCLARKAAAMEAAAALVDDGDELDDELEDFDDELVSEESVGRQIVVGDADWSKAVYSAVLECLQEPDSEDLELYMFRASPDKSVEIRIDKLTNKYGSPSLDDIERIARGVNNKLVENLGEEVAGQIEVGMSSPGADRPVEWHELQRFAEVPLEVTFYAPADTDVASSASDGSQGGAGRGPLTTQVMLVEDTAGTEQVVWKLADVKANAPGKGRRLNKKMREQRWTTAPQDIVSMNIHVDL